MTQQELDDSVMTPAQPERCIDCEARLAGESLRQEWDYCEYCGEAVCAQCESSHACPQLRENRPKKWL